MSLPAKLALLVSLAACGVGEVPDGNTPDAPPSNPAGEMSFMTMIQPLVGGCTACHGGTTAPNLTSFAALEPKYKMKPGMTNVLVTKGDTTQGMHYGIAYFNTTQQGTVAMWIDSL